MPGVRSLMNGNPLGGRFGRIAYREAPLGFPPYSIRGRRLPRRPTLRRIAILLLVFVPTVVITIYYGLIATDRYVSQAVFVVRSGNQATNTAGLSSLLTMLGVGRSESNGHEVEAFLTSREAVEHLEKHLQLATMFHADWADRLSRFPNLLYSDTQEGLYRYLQTRISVRLDQVSGVQTLRVEAFRAEDAIRIASGLLDLAEQKVNSLNERSEHDAVGHAEQDLAIAEQRLLDAQVALTSFRDRELMINANQNAAALVELIAKLSTQLADARVEIAQMLEVSASSPQLTPLRAREHALSDEISRERAQVAPGEGGLAAKLAEFERLELGQKFADRAVEAALAALEVARSGARRQHVFLDRVVTPNLPDEPTEPRRLETILTVFGLNAIGWGVAWLLFTGLREHARATSAG
jgi:capsular polysaccharide transport system permease protein